MFDEPLLKGAVSQPAFAGISINHFIEKRGDEISLDRMGASGLDRKVVKYLLPRAIAHGQSFGRPQRFDGWAIVAAKELMQARVGRKVPVIPSPITDQEPNDNIYHAHVVRSEGLDPYEMALHLRYIFLQFGKIEQNKPDEETWFSRLRVHPVARWLIALLPGRS
ncbi:hypothetical protein [Mesorhizobium sp.]|uniref:hypothetical protein n=1 Tax=Mesorhizobium sp. TaxID=1871066 RepID=UPI000FE9DC86|nr:hypothetical protein [Mesorhizobium sp.]RWM08959.1 MAG: hypothetical protein EOR71_10620 [Mesorhizobium sp.]